MEKGGIHRHHEAVQRNPLPVGFGVGFQPFPGLGSDEEILTFVRQILDDLVALLWLHGRKRTSWV